VIARAALFLLSLGLACEPAARGLCARSTDCRNGQACALEGICVAVTPTSCTPACDTGQVCNEGTCVVLKPSVTVTLDAGTYLSPHDPAVRVHIDASPIFGLGALALEADTDHAVASG